MTWQLLDKVWADFFFFLVFGGMIFLDFIAHADKYLAQDHKNIEKCVS